MWQRLEQIILKTREDHSEEAEGGSGCRLHVHCSSDLDQDADQPTPFFLPRQIVRSTLGVRRSSAVHS